MGRRDPYRDPFLVMATQNPVELEETFPLPEAQIDRSSSPYITDSVGVPVYNKQPLSVIKG
jgi:MoxR-like ATPase